MGFYRVNPISDPRWTALVEKHPLSSVFHTVPWLQALERTYGYSSVAFTNSSPNEKLENGAVFSRVRSWLTGQRLVSLPFSDYCDFLFDSAENLDLLARYLRSTLDNEAWKYIEVRPTEPDRGKILDKFKFHSSSEYVLHRIDLQRDSNSIFKSFDKDSIQRRIRRAERAHLTEKSGRSECLLKDFYDLLVITRSRHQVPPQPYEWFHNLTGGFGDALEIRVAYKESTPVAAILTLRFKDKVYYKYGGSDRTFNNLGATPLLLWRAVEEAKFNGAVEFDLGRTDADNQGLIAFKDKWGSSSRPLVYLRLSSSSLARGNELKLKMMKKIFARMPPRLLEFTGKLIYRHIG